MTPFAYSVAAVLLTLWSLWYLYIIVIGIYHAHLKHTLSLPAKILGAPAIIVGFILDWLINWTIASIWFLELPDTPLELVTGRLARYLKNGTERQKRNANSICTKLLDIFDPNPQGHCR
jgi:hypothetical protein